MKDDSDDLAPRQVRPTTWDEVFAITGGLKGVSIDEIERGRADWRYDFSSKDMRPCGRKGCETLHCHGWVVAIAGRRFVHIGICCAAKYAHVDLWNERVRDYRKRQDSDAHAAAFVRVREQAQQKQHWLDTSPGIARAVALYDAFTAVAPRPVLKEVQQRADKMRPTIERDFKLTPEEIEMRRIQLSGAKVEGEPGPYIAPLERRPVGELSGLNCFRWGGGPRAARDKLQRLVDTLLTWTPKQSDRDAERCIREATRELGPYSNDLTEALFATDQFFSESNLRTLVRMDSARSQGVLAINVDEAANTVEIVRRPHWNRAA